MRLLAVILVSLAIVALAFATERYDEIIANDRLFETK